MSADDALSWGWVGPCLRGSGVAYDIRKDHPYSGYDQYDFDVPVGTLGDCYDRYLVRMEEIRQSLRIIEQALARLPAGAVIVDDKKVALPPKSEVYSNIEALMNHFKLIYDGILPPAGEVYGYTEGANGELGYYVVSDGRKFPWRVKVRPPCFNIYQAFPDMIKGGMLADAVAIIGGLNVIAGELDR
jgi:NADH:ubiquinone oxidoreductase subunit D